MKLGPFPTGAPWGSSAIQAWLDRLRHIYNAALDGHIGIGGTDQHPVFTTTDAGFAPASGSEVDNFLRDDGTWQTPVIEAFPVGAVFIGVVSTSPATLLGYGTWSAFGAGRVLVGRDSGDTDFDTVEETGGAKTVASTGTNSAEAAHTHAYTQVVNHTHTVDIGNANEGVAVAATTNFYAGTTNTVTATTGNPAGGVASGTTGAGSSHTHTYTGNATSIVQPYIVVYMWKRTA